MRISEPKQRNRPQRCKSSIRYKAAWLAVNDKSGVQGGSAFRNWDYSWRPDRAQELEMFVSRESSIELGPQNISPTVAVQARQDAVGKSPCRRTVSLGDQRHRRRFGRVFRPPSHCHRLLMHVSSVSWRTSLLPAPLDPRLFWCRLSALVSRPSSLLTSSLKPRLWALVSLPPVLGLHFRAWTKLCF